MFQSYSDINYIVIVKTQYEWNAGIFACVPLFLVVNEK